MRIACLSGKGGTGKTLVAVNLANAIEDSTYIDCDVEEPNGHLFFNTPIHLTKMITSKVPMFEPIRCVGCKECVKHCRFHALAYIKDCPKLFADVCHHCGLCMLVCKHQAISEIEQEIGKLTFSKYNKVNVVSGFLNPGVSSGVPVIKEALKYSNDWTIIDGPPGASCPVIEVTHEADYCVIVVEPTSFGLHNMKMIYELISIFKKPCGIIINKETIPYEPLEVFCQSHQLPILARIPYRKDISKKSSEGEIISERIPEMNQLFKGIYTDIRRLYE